jgi:DNA-binding MarR family transcriptional regulator
MSTRIMAICWPVQVPPTEKAVLISLADNANDTGFCWPSIATICERTCLGKSTVIRAIASLEGRKLLRANRDNGRHSTYTLDAKAISDSVAQNEQPVSERDRCQSGTGVRAGPDRCHSDTGPVSERDTNHKEPPLNRHTRASKAVEKTQLPEWVPLEAWSAFLEMRKSIKKSPTPYAVELLFGELKKLRDAGNDPKAVIEQSIANNWAGVFPLKQQRKRVAEDSAWVGAQ